MALKMVGMKLLFPVSTVESPNMRMAGKDPEIFSSKALHGLLRNSSQIMWSDGAAMRRNRSNEEYLSYCNTECVTADYLWLRFNFSNLKPKKAIGSHKFESK